MSWTINAHPKPASYDYIILLILPHLARRGLPCKQPFKEHVFGGYHAQGYNSPNANIRTLFDINKKNT